MAEPAKDDIKELLDRVEAKPDSWAYNMTYQEGIVDALNWVLDLDSSPLEEEE